MSVELRVLDPTADIELFREAYSWRSPKKHLQPDRMPFEEFSKDDPSHIAVGVYDEHLVAVYFFQEYEAGRFESHFTSRKFVSRQILLEAAHLIITCFFSNGASQFIAWIVEQNRPLRSFVESLGFSASESREFDGKPFIRYSLTAS